VNVNLNFNVNKNNYTYNTNVNGQEEAKWQDRPDKPLTKAKIRDEWQNATQHFIDMIKNSSKNKPLIVPRVNPLTKGQHNIKNNNFIPSQIAS